MKSQRFCVSDPCHSEYSFILKVRPIIVVHKIRDRLLIPSYFACR